jgi:hypothetical protein
LGVCLLRTTASARRHHTLHNRKHYGKEIKKALSRRAAPAKVTRRFLETLTGAKEDAYRRVLDALALGRRNKLSATKAAKASGTTVKTMRKYAPGAIEQHGGRYAIAPSDRLPRRMRMLTTRGEVIVRTTSSRTATRIAEHNNAIRTYLVSGDPAHIAQYKDRVIRSGGKVYTFATDRRTIDRYARAGGVHFVDVYARGAVA